MRIRPIALLPLVWVILQTGPLLASETTPAPSTASNELRRPTVAIVLGGGLAEGGHSALHLFAGWPF